MVLAFASLPGWCSLCCPSQLDTYEEMLDPPDWPTAWTWTFMSLLLAGTLLVPLARLVALPSVARPRPRCSTSSR